MRKDKVLNGDLDRLPAFDVASDVPPLQGERELVADVYLGLRSALRPRLSHDGLSALAWPLRADNGGVQEGRSKKYAAVAAVRGGAGRVEAPK